jgi:hypothetical protein
MREQKKSYGTRKNLGTRYCGAYLKSKWNKKIWMKKQIIINLGTKKETNSYISKNKLYNKENKMVRN